MVQFNPYVSFKDNAREALEFYQSVFGGKTEFHTFGEYDTPHTAGYEEKIMHGMLEAPSITFMAADTPPEMTFNEGSRISLSLSGDDDTLLSDYFTKLAEGGSITVPLEAAPWGDKFGMLVDKFGIAWMVNISGKKAE